MKNKSYIVSFRNNSLFAHDFREISHTTRLICDVLKQNAIQFSTLRVPFSSEIIRYEFTSEEDANFAVLMFSDFLERKNE